VLKIGVKKFDFKKFGVKNMLEQNEFRTYRFLEAFSSFSKSYSTR